MMTYDRILNKIDLRINNKLRYTNMNDMNPKKMNNEYNKCIENYYIKIKFILLLDEIQCLKENNFVTKNELFFIMSEVKNNNFSGNLTRIIFILYVNSK